MQLNNFFIINLMQQLKKKTIEFELNHLQYNLIESPLIKVPSKSKTDIVNLFATYSKFRLKYYKMYVKFINPYYLLFPAIIYCIK